MAYYDWKRLIADCIKYGARPKTKAKDIDMMTKCAAWMEESGAPCPGPSQRKWVMDIASFLGEQGLMKAADYEIANPGDSAAPSQPANQQREAPAPVYGRMEDNTYVVERLKGADSWDVRLKQGNHLLARVQMESNEARAVHRMLTDMAARGAVIALVGIPTGEPDPFDTPPPAPTPTPTTQPEQKATPNDDDNLPF